MLIRNSIQAEKKKLTETYNELFSLQEKFRRLELANSNERTSLETQKNQLSSRVSTYENELKALKNQLRVSAEKFKLKEEEIYELKSNYEAQIEELTTEKEKTILENEMDSPIRLIPLALGQQKPEEKKKSSSTPSHSHSIIHNTLQNKIYSLSDRFFDVKDQLIEKETELKSLKDELRQKGMVYNNNIVELDTLKEKMKSLEDQIMSLTTERDALKKNFEKVTQDYEKEICDLKAQLNDTLKKNELMKKEIGSKSGSQITTERIGNAEVSKIIGKMLNILRKSKKLFELKEEEITKIKDEVAASLQKP